MNHQSNHFIVICLLQMYICGQALSHCVNYTMRDFFNYWNGAPEDMVLLRDGIANTSS
jgi:nicotinamidase-related amidase